MDKTYNKIVFVNNQEPDLDATNMNAISNAIDEIDNRVIALNETVEQNSEVITQHTEAIAQNTEDIEALKHKPSGITLTSASPLESSAAAGIAGLSAKGKSEQYISKNLYDSIGNPIKDLAYNAANNEYRVNGETWKSTELLGLTIGKSYVLSADLKLDAASSDEFDFLRIDKTSGPTVIRFLNKQIGTSYTRLSASFECTEAVKMTLRNAGSVKGYIRNIQINEGSTALPYEPYTGTPTPTNPIPIVDASGVVEAHTEGNNLLALTYDVANKYYETNGTYNDSSAWNSSSEYFEASGALIFKYPMSVNLQTLFCEYDENKNFIKRVFLNYGAGNPTKTEGETVVLNANTRYVRFSIHNTRPSHLNYGVNVEYKSNAINIEGNLIEEVWENKNTQDGDTIKRMRNANLVRLTKGETYTVTIHNSALNVACVVSYKDSAYPLTNYTLDSGWKTTYTFKAEDNGVLSTLIKRISEADITPDTDVKLMVERGSVATPYISYADSPHIHLRSIPNTNIADTLTVNEDGSGEWVQKVGVADLGSLNWSYNSGAQTMLADVSGLKNVASKSIVPNISSDIATAIAWSGNWVKDIVMSQSPDFLGKVHFYPTNTDSNAFRITMNGHTLYFELDTPIVYQLTADQVAAILALQTYAGTTIVDSELDDVVVDYVGDTKAYIDSKFEYLYELIRSYHPEAQMMSLDDEPTAEEEEGENV